MKRFLVVLFFLVGWSGLSAQKVGDTLRYAESIWSMEKKAMILDEMNLTEAEKAAFWPVYDSYSNAIQYLDMEYIRLLNYRQDQEEALSDKKAATVTENLLMNEVLLAKTRRHYFRKFKKALSAAQASRFMKLDNDFRTMIRLQMQKEPPALVTSIYRIYSRN
jgi:hypothetical protein